MKEIEYFGYFLILIGFFSMCFIGGCTWFFYDFSGLGGIVVVGIPFVAFLVVFIIGWRLLKIGTEK